MLIAASTLGAAQALAPIASELRRRGATVATRVPPDDEAIVDTFGSRPALGDEGWTHALVGVRRDPSGSAESLEQTVVRDALTRGVPCVGVVDGFDTWFPRADRSYPRWLAVPDPLTARLVVARGCPPESVHVTGNPALHLSPSEERARARVRARARLALEDGARWIAFVTQPSVNVVERLSWVRSALRPGDRLVVIVHPRDHRDYREYHVHRLNDPHDIAGFDVVLFHSSTVGVHAMLMGVPTVCVMTPAEWQSFAIVGGYTPVALGLCEWGEHDLAAALVNPRSTSDGLLRDSLLLDGSASDRIIALLLQGAGKMAA